MISHEHKCIFIHIPKTGGMSIEQALGVDLSKFHSPSTSIKIKHGTPDDWLYPQYWDKYFTFTFVRNPWARIVSSYCYIQNRSLRCDRFRGWKLKRFFQRQESYSINGFRSFVKKWLPRDFKYYDLWFAPQLSWLSADYDFIGRLENLQQDFNIVCDKIGIPRFSPSHINKTEHKHYIEYYDDETREIVAEKYAKDIEYFGYEFGG
jgi:chondroitin 4-sulfotransferase 11